MPEEARNFRAPRAKEFRIPPSVKLVGALDLLRQERRRQVEDGERLQINVPIETVILPRIEQRLSEPIVEGDPLFRQDVDDALAYFERKHDPSDVEVIVRTHLRRLRDSFKSSDEKAA